MVGETLAERQAVEPYMLAVVTAYLRHNALPPAEVPRLITSVRDAFVELHVGIRRETPVAGKPAVPVHRSVTPEYLVCLEDGKKRKVLTRYLRRKYNLSPNGYRERWNLPETYPMVAPNYAKARSAIAKSYGLGQRREKPKRTR